MKIKNLLPIGVVMFLVTSCSSIQVTYDYDKDVNFDQLKSYAFFKDGIDQVKVNDMDKKRILHAIDQTLESKGFAKASSNPNFLINIYTKAEQQVNVHNNNSAFYGPYGYYGWGWGPYWGPTTTVSTNIEGTLYIDILDTQKKTLVWQGIGRGYINKDATPEKKEQRIKEMVEKILTKFPPGELKK
ncbi:MAG: DUF4136 domain-containing protein [Flavobacteriaceae bacterium]|jgi:hypothetical protein|nr:DUF4136 domain-containing protein [Flavobacteriaceae bacterium]